MSIRDLIGRITDRRRASRIQTQGLAAYYWTGGIPKPQDVSDIGLYGAHIIAPDVFYPGTLVQIMLENRAAMQGDGKNPHISVCGRVCRKTSEGFCVAFSFADGSERRQLRRFLQGVTRRAQPEAEPAGLDESNAKDRSEDAAAAANTPRPPGQNEVTLGQDKPQTMRLIEFKPGEEKERNQEKHMEDKKRRSNGQALIESALILPLLFLLIVNVINFGGFLYDWIAVSNAARTGAQYLCTGGATVGAPAPPIAAAVSTLVLNDMHALPNSASAQVCVSKSSSVTVTCNTGSAPAGAPPPVDTAEGGITYVVGAVDVKYTYQPFIPLWDFPNLRIHATLPPTTIHRQARMRMLE